MDDYVFKRYPMYDRVYICIFVYTFGGVFKKFSMQEFSRDIGVLSSRARSDGLVICTVIHVFNVNHFF